MKHFVLIPNLTKDPDYRVTREAAAFLLGKGAVLYAQRKHAACLTGVLPYDGEEIPEDAEALIVLGGDGSMIDAAATALANRLPLVGINLGRLGYLTCIEPNDLTELAVLLQDTPPKKEHITLRVCIHHADGRTTERIAVNDIVISRGSEVGMAQFSLKDDTPGDASLNYDGDGLIVCTPLGSTAYSLSAGGPIVDSGLEAMCVTPICVHSFFSRSILFSPQATLTITNTSARGTVSTVTVDGHDTHILAAGEKMTVTSSGERLSMLNVGHYGVLDALRKKMIFSNAKF